MLWTYTLLREQERIEGLVREAERLDAMEKSAAAIATVMGGKDAPNFMADIARDFQSRVRLGPGASSVDAEEAAALARAEAYAKAEAAFGSPSEPQGPWVYVPEPPQAPKPPAGG